jgi:hypothetical protein
MIPALKPTESEKDAVPANRDVPLTSRVDAVTPPFNRETPVTFSADAVAPPLNRAAFVTSRVDAVAPPLNLAAFTTSIVVAVAPPLNRATPVTSTVELNVAPFIPPDGLIAPETVNPLSTITASRLDRPVTVNGVPEPVGVEILTGLSKVVPLLTRRTACVNPPTICPPLGPIITFPLNAAFDRAANDIPVPIDVPAGIAVVG